MTRERTHADLDVVGTLLHHDPCSLKTLVDSIYDKSERVCSDTVDHRLTRDVSRDVRRAAITVSSTEVQLDQLILCRVQGRRRVRTTGRRLGLLERLEGPGFARRPSRLRGPW